MEEKASLPSFVHTTIGRCLRQLREAVTFDRAGIWLYSKGALTLQGNYFPPMPGITSVASLPPESIFYQVARNAEALVVRDTQAERFYLSELGTARALAVLPLTLEGHLLGILGVSSQEIGYFDPDRLEKLQSQARQLAIAIKSAQEHEGLLARYLELSDVYQETGERAEQSRFEEKDLRQSNEDLHSQVVRLFTLHETGKAMQRLHDEAAIADYAAQAIVAEMNLERGLILLLDKQGKQLECRASADQQGIRHDEWSIPLNGGLIGDVVLANVPVFVADAARETKLETGFWDRLPVTSLIATPILVENRPQGVLVAGSQYPYSRLVKEDIGFISLLTTQVGRALENAWVFNRTLRRVGELASLYAIGVAMASTTDLDEMLRAIHNELGEVLDTSFFSIALFDHQNNRLDFRLTFEGSQQLDPFSMPLEDQDSLEWNIIQQVEPMLVEELGDCQLYPLGASRNRSVLHSWVGVPITLRDQALGLLSAGSRQPRSFDKQHLWLLSAVANQTAIAMENHRLYSELRRLNIRLENRVQTRTAELTTLNEISRAVNSTLDLKQLLDRVMDVLSQSFAVERASLLLLNEASQELSFAMNLGGDLKTLQKFPLEKGKGIAGWVAQTGQIAIVNNPEKDPRFFPDVSKSLGFVVRSLLCVPLQVKGHAIGVIELLNKLSGDFSQEDADRLLNLISPIAIAIENARYYSEAQKQAAERLALYSVARELRSLRTLVESPEAIFRRIVEIIAQASQRYQAVGLYTLHKDELALRAQQGYAQPDRPLPIGEQDAIAQVLSAAQAILIRDIARQPGYVTVSTDALSAAVLPLRDWRGTVTGILLVESPQILDKADLDLLEAFAEQVAVALENILLYRDLQEANVNLVKVNDARIEFVSSVSHELRTPMTAIKGYTDMLISGMTGPLSEPQMRFLGIIKNNADRLGILVGDLLEVSRLEAGRIRLKLAPIQVDKLIYDSASTLQGQMVAKKLAFSTLVPARLPAIWADSDRMIQILTNLLSNACKYTLEGGSIQVSASLQEEKNEAASGQPARPFIKIEIADSGIGIAPEEQSKVFQRFFRADNQIVREQIGTGLGLSIVRGLVELHGGRIWFASEAGKGTRFTFLVPIATAEQIQNSESVA